jgi:hypothetical protein
MTLSAKSIVDAWQGQKKPPYQSVTTLGLASELAKQAVLALVCEVMSCNLGLLEAVRLKVKLFLNSCIANIELS